MTEVFILGAGFSRGYNTEIIPLISDFLKIAENKGILKPNDEHKELVNFIQKYFGDNYQNVNIETLATFLTTDLIPDVSQKNEYREKLYRQLNSIIIATLYNPYNKPQNEKIKKIYQNFAYKLIEKESHVITFNYDLILDNLLKNTTHWSIHDGYGVKINPATPDLPDISSRKFYNVSDEKSENSKIQYLKLHGSLNWGRSILPHPYKGDEILISPFGYGKDNEQEILPIENMCSGYNIINLYYQSFIIPPVLTKQDLYKTLLLQNIWYKAKWAINRADEIYVIGYSFPPSDFTAEFLFRQALTFLTKSTPKKVNLVNIKISEEYINRIENIFPKCEINPIEQDVVSFLETYK